MSLLGTFLVRSGVLMSVHAFAQDPERGVYLLIMISILFFIAFAILCARWPKLKAIAGSPDKPFKILSRENGLMINSAILMVALFTILIGTLYPLVLDAFHLGAISVGAPYFNAAMLPLVCTLMLLMGITPFLSWQTTDKKALLHQLKKNFLLSVVFGFLLLFLVKLNMSDVITAINLILCFWVLLSVMSSFKKQPAMTLAHIGFAIFMLGIVLSTLLNQEREVRLQPGQRTDVGPYHFFFMDAARADGTNYRGFRANFEVMKNKHYITQLHPEKRIYNVREMVMTKVDIHPGIFRDLYIALGEPLEDNAWSVRIYYKPFIRFIWLGGLLMIVGGCFALRRRH